MQNTREGSTLGKGHSGPLVKEVVPGEEMRDPTEATSTVVQEDMVIFWDLSVEIVFSIQMLKHIHISI